MRYMMAVSSCVFLSTLWSCSSVQQHMHRTVSGPIMPKLNSSTILEYFLSCICHGFIDTLLHVSRLIACLLLVCCHIT